jgi:hypothetical protein
MGRTQIGAQLQVKRVDLPVLERQRHQFGDIAVGGLSRQALLCRGPAAQKLVPLDDDTELHFLVMGPLGFEGPLAFIKHGHVPATPSWPASSRESIAPGHDVPLSAG